MSIKFQCQNLKDHRFTAVTSYSVVRAWNSTQSLHFTVLKHRKPKPVSSCRPKAPIRPGLLEAWKGAKVASPCFHLWMSSVFLSWGLLLCITLISFALILTLFLSHIWMPVKILDPLKWPGIKFKHLLNALLS